MTVESNAYAEDYVIRVSPEPAVSAQAWNELLHAQSHPTPFMRHEYLCALNTSQSACATTGWEARWVSLHARDSDALMAAAVMYIKPHSYGEYVFDWSWANAYAQHRLPYYPKATLAVPFTPVPGSRLLARNDHARAALVQALVQVCRDESLSSLHVLFASDTDLQALQAAGLMARHTVQFHWHNRNLQGEVFQDFEDFLASLSQDKRKKIRQERRKVSEAGVQFRWAQGADISVQDWAFFYRCYERTYLEHGNAPYLTPDFFQQMARHMPEHWLLFIAEIDQMPIASSLIALSADKTVAYGRYWGALQRVDCLHFEACYYQPLAWCIAHGVQRFEGGAQGEHKMARALLPVRASSAHWIAHPQFRAAIDNFLTREAQGVDNYMEDLQARSPLRQAP